MIKPLFVYINWSESPEFEENSLVDFDNFELKCFSITSRMEPNEGYDKTDIEVLFSDGSRYGARVDLDPGCRGFKDHAQNRIKSSKEKERSDFLKSVEF